jgi:hypothetical protein
MPPRSLPASNTILPNRLPGSRPISRRARGTTLIVMVHGSGDNYQRPPQSALGARLAAKGYATLAINTRQHDAAINTENFFRCASRH